MRPTSALKGLLFLSAAVVACTPNGVGDPIPGANSATLPDGAPNPNCEGCNDDRPMLETGSSSVLGDAKGGEKATEAGVRAGLTTAETFLIFADMISRLDITPDPATDEHGS